MQSFPNAHPLSFEREGDSHAGAHGYRARIRLWYGSTQFVVSKGILPMRSARLSWLFQFVLLAALAGCAAQQQSSGTPDYPAAARAATAPLKLCPVPDGAPADLVSRPGFTEFTTTVTDTSGALVASLKQSDFEVHSAAQSLPVAYFHNDAGAAPESIILVIDTSGSMHPKLPTVTRALGGFIGKLNSCDEIAIIAFSDQPYLIQPFTTDHLLAAGKLSILRANGETAIYDSIDKAVDAERKTAHYPARAIILITDGIDNKSTATKDEAIAKVKRSGAQLFLVGIGDPNVRPDSGSLAIGPFVINGGDIDRVDARTLKEFASATGGNAYVVRPTASGDDTGNNTATNDEFPTAIAKIQGALGHGYTLGVVLPPGVAAAAVTVAVPSHPDAKVTAHPAPDTKPLNS